ncbi:hypothetical protein JG687_00005438 [Phytophthora cactorum]|uniref:Uncharacterized protein n=1 Tax=Phytophthora cactorum TaxID=29920 RepID=A0A8T1UQM2_9STRA|nr:hypothetical protein JG687_00005438 [Phytophthora cactorum]
MWVVYERGRVAHLGNSTNNLYATSVLFLQEILKLEMELNERVETLNFLQSTAEMKYAAKFRVIESRHYRGADDILLRLAALVCPHAFGLVRQEYEPLWEVLSRTVCVGYIIEFKTTTREYEVNVSVSEHSVYCSR